MKIYQQLPDGVNIVEYEDALAQAVADMWNQSGESWGGDMTVRTAKDISDELKSGAYFNIYIAEKDGEALGFASLSKYYRDDNALYLHVLNVRPDWHGKKLGKALVLCCVARTIELGYPRLDIHTWPGNTKSVPLYKKCGYMWEDRVDSTHLVNFIPTVLSTEASAHFFDNADWYEDSTRVIELKPDGVKQDGFEMFTYAWQKNDSRLYAGFERTGRRMRLLETDAYRITLTAENHELAFGLDYTCAFEVVNKTGAPLSVRLQGKNDRNIRFDYAETADVTGTRTFDARFFVGEITEPQDIWQVHPCVLADVYINGQHAEFGLGVETKWPVSLAVEEMKKIAKPGTVYDSYFNLTSTLRGDASVTLHMPEAASVIRYALDTRTADIPAMGKTSFNVKAEALSYGHEALPVTYTVKLADGRTVSYTRPLHSVSRGLTGACGYETETDYVLQNGTWLFGLSKNGSYAWTNHIFDAPGAPGFPIGQLGRPYSDEFERMKPFNVAILKQDDTMVMEASYRSAAFPGTVYTSVYTLGSGIFTRKHRVTNENNAPVSLSLKDESHPALRRHTVLPYNGGIQTIRDGLSSCAVSVDRALIDENWAFEANPRYTTGICWPPAYRLNIRWGDAFYFEHDFTLAPGASFETEPVTITHGHFTRYHEFRDFAMQTYTTDVPDTTPHLDFELNGGNPFSTVSEWTAAIRHDRSALLDGDIRVSASGKAFVENGNRLFTLPQAPTPHGAVEQVTLDMKLKNFEKTYTKAVFIPRADGKVSVTEQGGVWTVDNGAVVFKCDPAFSDACYSLSKDGHEWLMSKYPSRAPHSWFNPFIGGLNTELDHMRDAMTIREPISAAEATETDTLGNVWLGVVTTVKVENFDEHKGVIYDQYYLTLPGLPVLCYFVRLRNHTGLYKKLWLHTDLFAGHPADIRQLTVTGTGEDGITYRFPVGSDSWYREVGRLVTVEAADALSGDKLYLYRNTGNGRPITFDIDTNIVILSTHYPAEMENGGVFTARPVFVMVTPQTLDTAQLVDLDRVTF